MLASEGGEVGAKNTDGITVGLVFSLDFVSGVDGVIEGPGVFIPCISRMEVLLSRGLSVLSSVGGKVGPTPLSYS